jgi:hypothetical protein
MYSKKDVYQVKLHRKWTLYPSKSLVCLVPELSLLPVSAPCAFLGIGYPAPLLNNVSSPSKVRSSIGTKPELGSAGVSDPPGMLDLSKPDGNAHEDRREVVASGRAKSTEPAMCESSKAIQGQFSACGSMFFSLELKGGSLEAAELGVLIGFAGVTTGSLYLPIDFSISLTIARGDGLPFRLTKVVRLRLEDLNGIGGGFGAPEWKPRRREKEGTLSPTR